jgi:putative transcriptional regulator
MSKTGTTRVTMKPGDTVPGGKTDWVRLDAMTDEEALAAARSDPDAQPLTPEQLAKVRRVSRVKVLRQRLGMTQAEFGRAFHLPITTLRDWEQHRSVLDAPARALLLAIERDPEVMQRLLSDRAAQPRRRVRAVARSILAPRRSNLIAGHREIPHSTADSRMKLLLSVDSTRPIVKLIRKPSDEPQSNSEPSHVLVTESPNPLPHPFAPYDERLVGHHLPFDPQSILGAWLDGGAKIPSIHQFGSQLADHHGRMVLREGVTLSSVLFGPDTIGYGRRGASDRRARTARTAWPTGPARSERCASPHGNQDATARSCARLQSCALHERQSVCSPRHRGAVCAVRARRSTGIRWYRKAIARHPM